MKNAENELNEKYLQTFDTIFPVYYAFDNILCNISEKNELDFHNLLNDDPHRILIFEPKRNILMSNSNYTTRRFAFSSEANGFISAEKAKINILTEFLNAKLDESNSKKKSLISLMKEYGFLLPITTYERISYDDIVQLIKRLKITVELLDALSKKEICDYEKILALTMTLLLATPIEIRLHGFTYTSYVNDYYRLIHTDNLYLYHNNSLGFYKGEYEKSEKLMTELVSILHNNDNTFCSEEYKINLYDKYEEKELKKSDEIAELETTNIEDNIRNKLYYTNKILFDICQNTDNIKKDILKIVFFINYYEENVGEMKSCTKDKVVHYGTPNLEKFTDEMKKELLGIAKNLVAQEINHNIKDLQPYFDAAKCQFTWKFNSLLEALYFSLSFHHGAMKMYRCCPKCNDYFLINRSNEKKMYCENCRDKKKSNKSKTN
ncbi:MAG: hypothetical protein ACI4I6_05435 [Hominimerdicola sp.]